ncbi:MAG: phosphoenolpyruvate--protein phosphotransferase [Desulfobacteraceae bacterium]|jgi:phosphotransferase system enzyme I (PtsP)
MSGKSKTRIKKTKTEHLGMICNISELSHLMAESKDIDSFLEQVVQLVASHMKAHVGSIYLLEPTTGTLVLKANVGLHPDSVGRIRLQIGEGLVGWALEAKKAIRSGNVRNHQRFKHFKNSNEERYKSFLAVPICHGTEKTGVLVVQHTRADYFKLADVLALRAIAAQLAGTIANVRLMMAISHLEKPAGSLPTSIERNIIKGEPAVSGFALAPAVTMRSADPLLTETDDDAFKLSLADFKQALGDTVAQLTQLQEQLVSRLPESAALIFEAHHMILKDPNFVDRISTLICQGHSAPSAIRQVARHFIALFEKNPNVYIREKSRDIEDLARRLLFNLRREPIEGHSPLNGRIVIAVQLYPSDLLKLASESVAGVILVGGGVASHVTIVARSLGIPMIIAAQDELLNMPYETRVLMDADIGNIYIDPSEGICRQFHRRNQARNESADSKAPMQDITTTRDGRRIRLMANINLLSELDLAREFKAEGIGLYRSEFPFFVRSDFPSEEEQRIIYETLFARKPKGPTWIRTLDVGGDKVLPYLARLPEDNPELGLRSIRFSLRHRDIFDQQIRAILRAGADCESLGIMFPMISSIDEFRAACRAVREAGDALAKEQLPHHSQPLLGAMIELPAIIEVIDELVLEADFLSIGTNDLVQYMLAADRNNEHVAAYYQPYNPSVLRALARIARQGQRQDVPISICGEVAHQTDFVPFLIGIGIRRLSVDPQFLPDLQRTIQTIDGSEAEAYVRQVLTASTLADVDKVRADWNWGRLQL